VQGLEGGVEVAEVEVGHFGAADAGGVEEFEDGAIAQAKRAGEIGEVEQAGNFRFAEGFRQVSRLFAREVEVGGRVGQEHAGAAQPGEKPLDAPKAGKLAVSGERLTSPRRAVVEQEQLIFFK
jgi:hypothetical protein